MAWKYKEDEREYQKKWYAEHKEEKKVYDKNNRTEAVKEKIRAQHKERNILRKAQAFDLLGDKCAICGFDDERALEVDHINGGGYKERLKIKSVGIYRKIIIGEVDNYQLLCSNCNSIKGTS